jgi:hypothetical protein
MPSALTDLQLLLGQMKDRTANPVLHSDLNAAIRLAELVAEEVAVATPVELLEALVPGTIIRDGEGDRWRKTKNGNWRLLAHDKKIVMSSKAVDNSYGPINILPWKKAS